MKESLIKDHQFLESEIKALETEVKKIIKNAEEFALSSPLPELEELYTEVYL